MRLGFNIIYDVITNLNSIFLSFFMIEYVLRYRHCNGVKCVANP